MPTKKLTAAAVERLAPPERGRVEYFDSVLTGLSLRITDKGRKSWSLMYRTAGRQRRLTLGGYPALDLKEARAAAKAALQEVGKGNDPATAKRDRRVHMPDVFEHVVDEFLEKHAKRHTRSWPETERIFRAYVTPRWRSRPITAISRHEVIDLLEMIHDGNGPIMANRTLAAVRKLFNWALERDIVETSPVANIRAPGRETKRDRTLSDPEVKALWNGCEELGWPFGSFIRVLLLTAQRRDEVATMKWDDLNLENHEPTWILPREATKADRAHAVPLAPVVVEILGDMPQVGSYVFMTGRRGDKSISGYSVMKRRIDEITGLDGWTIHDLRRTAASGMARLNVPPHVLSRILNHSPDKAEGVTAIYNRHGYDAEKRHALEAWASHVQRLVEPAPANVVRLETTD